MASIYKVLLALLLSAASINSASLPVLDEEPPHVSKRCTGSQYDLTVTNYNKANTDAWLVEWWAAATPSQKSAGLTAALVAEFLPNNRDFECGINSVCKVGDCDSKKIRASFQC